MKTSPAVRFTLIGLALAVLGLAVFQWIELSIVQQGGHAICAMGQTFNCEAVWDSAAAKKIHQVMGVPVAGLGLIWAAAAVITLLAFGSRERQRRPVAPLLFSLRILAWLGLVSVVLFAFLSWRLKTVCITCVGTYVLVLAFFILARRLPRMAVPEAQKVQAFLWLVVPGLVVYLAALFPGVWMLRTSRPTHLQWQAAHPGSSGLEEFLTGLTGAERQRLSDILEFYKSSPQRAARPPRFQWGPATAPVHFLEFTDIRCSHCRTLVEEMDALKKTAPAGSFSVEARHFPLDKECNPLVPGSDGTHLRCLGAKAQICLEGAPDYWTLRGRLFAEQSSLTPERIVEIASSGSTPRAQLEQCVASSETNAKLQDDIHYAEEFNPEGTPIVIMNGRQVPPSPPFLFSMILAGGKVDAPALSSLPPSRNLAR